MPTTWPPGRCPNCKADVGLLPYDWSDRPKLIVCFSHDPPATYCEACDDDGLHGVCGKLRRKE